MSNSWIDPDATKSPSSDASGRQNDRLGQDVANEPAAARAQRRARGDLAMTGDGACDVQVGHVRAGDQQQERDRPEEQQAPAVARLGRGSRGIPSRRNAGARRSARSGTVRSRVRPQRLELGLRSLGGHLGSQASDHAIVHAQVTRGRAQRREHIHARHRDEVPRKHADDGVRTAAEVMLRPSALTGSVKSRIARLSLIMAESGPRGVSSAAVNSRPTSGRTPWTFKIVRRDAQTAHADRGLRRGDIPARGLLCAAIASTTRTLSRASVKTRPLCAGDDCVPRHTCR